MRSVRQVLLTGVTDQTCDVASMCQDGVERCGQTAPFRVERLDGYVIGHVCSAHLAGAVIMEFIPPGMDV